MICRFPLLGTLLVLGGLVSGCASTGAVPHPFPTPSAPRTEAPAPAVASPVDEAEPPVATAEAREADEAAAPATAKPESVVSSAPKIDGYVIAGTALQLRGTPYRLGGADPKSGFDCSGLVQYVFGYYGIAVPRDVRSQYRAIPRIGEREIRPGDLLFFATDGDEVSHVAIAISSNQFVHSPNSRGVVRVETLQSDYWNPRYIGAARVIEAPPASTDFGRESSEAPGSPASPSQVPLP